ncbi:fluoride efflux transporter FluC [Halomonas binhaiensis]|uniref:Fluoride-specific ion channel FluC n=1 Tax=Halomonas binhaiensis TaxID=2562282 RepID=A0A5C1NNU2_9GAMM|nr:CrcB family protein [Halomonas binhaiensis]QEM83499.1 CrcB family protein [Halomonas binhaiensis]
MGQGWAFLGISLLVAAGGAVGGMGRLYISRWSASHLGSRFPWGTLIVNLAGAFVIGVLGGLVAQGSLAAMFLLTGVLGGFTTVSSLSLQTLDLLRERRSLAALSNVGMTLLLGLAAAALGWNVVAAS